MNKQRMLESKIAKEAEVLFEKYYEQMSALESKSLLSVVRPVNAYDIWAVGKQMEAFEFYMNFCEEEGNVNQLGKLPNIAFDVIAAAYGTSIVPLVSSVQPIEEEQGTVYFKTLKATDTKGNLTAAQDILHPKDGTVVTPQGYASNLITAEACATTVDATLTYNFTLDNVPIKSQTLTVYCAANSEYGKDDGAGVILGVGLSGTINYITGAVSITLATNPGDSEAITADYQINYELASDLPRIETYFASLPIMARVYALKGSTGMLQSFAMQKRFGMIAEDELAKDLVGEVNAEIGGDLIKKLNAGAQGNTNWDRTVPSGTPPSDYRLSIKQAFSDCEAVMVGNAGRGTLNVMIAGLNLCAILETVPGFTKLTDGNTIGSHVFGTLDGRTIIRVNDATLLNADQGLFLWKPASPFEGPAVYAPFMPLVVTSTLPLGINPLNNQRAAAVWAGLEVTVPNYITRITITTS